MFLRTQTLLFNHYQKVVRGYYIILMSVPDIINQGNIPLKYLAKSLEYIADVDCVWFMDGWQDARGCRIEHRACVEYYPCSPCSL